MNQAETMTGGDALARQLVREGVELIFGIPGIQLDHALDGIARLDGKIGFWNVRHEQAAAYMADGYARGGRDFGVCMVVPGPGLLNAAAGIATAYACSSRVLVICGQLPSDGIGKDRGLLHEIRNQSALLESLTKWSAMAHTPAEIPGLLREAVHQLRSGRPRPVALEVPMDVLQATSGVRLVDVPHNDRSPLHPRSGDVTAAARLLAGAARPAIMAGGGILAAAASDALERVADTLGAPVVMSRNGRGALSDRHPLALGPMARSAVLAGADVVLVVGSRLNNPVGPSPRVPAGTRLITVNAEPTDLSLPDGVVLPILADARVFLEGLADELAGLAPPASERGREMASSLKRDAAQRLTTLGPQMAYLQALRSAIPDDGVLVSELTQIGYVAEIAYPVWQPGTLILPGYQGTLGFGFPTALGVKAADPARTVVSITGDGGFGWALQELATARRYDLGVVTVVFDNHAFGNVRRIQEDRFGGRVIASDLRNPDFIALGKAFDVATMRAEGPDELGKALRQAVSDGSPTLIEVPLQACPDPWGLILDSPL